MTPHNYEIVDCGAFCEVIFLASHPRICFGTFSTVSPESFDSTKIRNVIYYNAYFTIDNFDDEEA